MYTWLNFFERNNIIIMIIIPCLSYESVLDQSGANCVIYSGAETFREYFFSKTPTRKTRES